jgi:excisionase family DNA binding protein
MKTQLLSNSRGTLVPFPSSSALSSSISKLGRSPIVKAVGCGAQVAAATCHPDAINAPLRPVHANPPVSAHDHDPYLDRRAAAEYLSVKEGTLAAWASNKRVALPYAKLGRRVVYRKSDLDAFVAANLEGGAL